MTRRAVLLVAAVLAAVPPAAAQAKTAAPAFDSSRAWEHLRQLVAIGPRPAGSDALAGARAYIERQLTASGVAFTEQAWDDKTPYGAVRMVNVVATIPGARRERLVFSGHYDTKIFRAFRFVGANDGGSSAAFLIELARVLKGRRNPWTIEILFLDGEEAACENWTDCGTPEAPDNTYGSRHYVDAAKRAGTLGDIKANILVDMVADRDLRVLREENSTRWLTDAIWDAAQGLGYARYFAEASTPIEDDHMPFLAAGVPSVDLIDLDYAPWHTAGDTLDAVSARSMQIVGDALLAALPAIEARVGR
ncbi:MAG: M28 family peptidase [Acidobacteria bacterium]|nr:M28 family peptidase [Acidobacteriota bacterium]